MLNSNTLNPLTQAYLRMLSTKCVNKSYTYLIYICKQDLALNNQYAIKQNQSKTKQIIYIR